MTSDFKQLIEDDWQAMLRFQPLRATSLGDARYNHLLPTISEEAFANRLSELRAFETRWQQIDRNALSDDDQLNYDLFGERLKNQIGSLEHHEYRLPMNKTNGFHSYFPYLFASRLPHKTIADYENILARLRALPDYIAGQISVMQVGLDTGYIPPTVTLDGVTDQIHTQFVEDVDDSLFFAPFKRFGATIPTQEQVRLQDEGRTIIRDAVLPAWQQLLDFFEDTYYPASRDSIAAADLPEGDAYYRYTIRRETTLDLSPEEIHKIGLEEVAQIRAEMQAVVTESGFDGDIAAFTEFLRTDPQFYPDTADQLLKEAAYIVKRMEGKLPQLFKTLPRMPYGVVPMPAAIAPGNTTARYSPPSGDGTRAGEYWVNTTDLKSRPLYEMEALSLHEAVPGHHLQIALQMELDNLPLFRRYTFFNAYIEGWALYSERLGLDVGFYDTPYSNFGRLSFAMWRACRLVVDTGIHALGWTRQQAIDYMVHNTSLSLLNITNEVDRYIGWAGQSLSYKIGEIKMRELRQTAEDALGANFDIREFHDVILLSGALPLNILEQRVMSWIEAQKAS